MRNPKISVKDLLSKWGRRATRRDVDFIAWSTMERMVDGLGQLPTMLDIPRLKQAISARDVGELLGAADALTPSVYVSPSVLLRDRQIAECFKKYSFQNSPFNKREKALIRFWEAEEMCASANRRLALSVFLGGNEIHSEPVLMVLNHARRAISHCLGTFSPDEMLGGSRFGPGATLCVTGPFTTEYYKLAESEPTVGSGAWAYAEALLNYDRKWLAYLSGMHPLDVGGRFNLVADEVAPELRVTDQNKVTFVPKNAKTERSIAIEPYFSLYFQLGVGRMLRKRLKRRWGIDLDSQIANQEGALRGSVDGSLATIDFSMASDTLSQALVRLMIPEEWFNHLNRLRSPEFLLDGVKHRYQKFSSMGNGFTFELESLIFASIGKGVCSFLGLDPNEVIVFGDDVLLPTDAVDLFATVTSYLGLKINAEKSFTSGRFRESCGSDYLEGSPVRPVYCDELSTVQHVASLSNRLLALNRAVDFYDWDGSWLHGVVDHLRGFIPADVRQHLVGPPSECHDGYIHHDCLGVLARSDLVKWSRPWQTFLHPIIQFRPTIRRRGGPAAALLIQSALRHRPPDVLGGYDDSRLSRITGRDIGDWALGYTPCDGLHGALTNFIPV